MGLVVEWLKEEKNRKSHAKSIQKSLFSDSFWTVLKFLVLFPLVRIPRELWTETNGKKYSKPVWSDWMPGCLENSLFLAEDDAIYRIKNVPKQ